GTSSAERIYGDTVSSNFFSVLGVRPAAGRLFDERDRESVVVLSHRFWTRRFQNDPSLVGQIVPVNGTPRTVLGVAAEGFQGTTIRAPDVWVPFNGRTASGSVLMGGRRQPN